MRSALNEAVEGLRDDDVGDFIGVDVAISGVSMQDSHADGAHTRRGVGEVQLMVAGPHDGGIARGENRNRSRWVRSRIARGENRSVALRTLHTMNLEAT